MPEVARGRAAVINVEPDFPPGHPGRCDYDPDSPEAKEWARLQVSPLGERDFPTDHPKAVDTAGNTNHLTWSSGVDPHNPHLEPHTGRTPRQAAGVAALSAIASARAADSPVPQPLDAVTVTEALNAKRKELGRDILTPAEYSEVVGKIQMAAHPEEDPEVVAARITAQHQALAVLVSKGYSRNTALEMIGREGAGEILRRFPPE